MTSHAKDVLLVEDSPVDAEAILRAIRQQSDRIRAHHVRDGIECLDFLRHVGVYAQSPRPDLIVLDFNLPRMDGREVLKQLKRSSELMEIPVVGLTSNCDQTTIAEAYRQSLNAYVVKPTSARQLCDTLATTVHFWLEIAALPTNGRAMAG